MFTVIILELVFLDYMNACLEGRCRCYQEVRLMTAHQRDSNLFYLRNSIHPENKNTCVWSMLPNSGLVFANYAVEMIGDSLAVKATLQSEGR